MTYQIFIRPEALEDFQMWIATLDHELITPWLEDRVRLVSQTTGEWVVINLSEDSWQLVKDNFTSDKISKNNVS
jgi:hypothetical protein